MKIKLSLVVAVAIASLGVAAPFHPQEPDRKVYVVGTAHLDTQWRWTIQKTITDYIPNTLRMNLDYMDRYPGYVFSFEGSIRYQLAKEYYPELYAKMRERINEGRWRVAGSWIDAVDVNVTSPEALIRQNLYGNGFFEREFGKTSLDVFLPDCFGFGYSLPSIAAHCGLKGFTTQKLLTYGSSFGGVPFNIGTWEGVDGSSIAAVLEPGRYRYDVGADWNGADWLMKRIDDLGSKSGLFLDVRLHGTGDRGGGPTQKSMDNLAVCMKADGPIKVLSKGSDDLFRELDAPQLAKLPHYNGELLMKTHGTGCYTSLASAKRWNRKNELLADAAEKAATMAALFGAEYPQAKLNEAWTRFLWHGFHDDLTGTSIPEVYTFTWNDQILSLNQFAEVLTDSIRTVASVLDTRVKGVPVVVYSPLASPRHDVVRATLTFGGKAPDFVRVVGPDGKETPAQVIRREGPYAEVEFAASTKGIEAVVYDVRRASAVGGSALKVTDRSLENERYLVRLNDAGDIASVFDKSLKRELLREPVRYEILKDKPTRYASWEINYSDVSADPVGYVDGPAKFRVLERGPARVALEVTRRAAGSTFVETIGLAVGGARVEVDVAADWRSRGTMLKATFPLAAGAPSATYDLGLGTIARGNNRPESYEVPAQQWADVSSAAAGSGVAVLSDCKYGWDKPDDGTLRLTLLRTPEAGDKDYQSHNDFGRHRFGFALYGHSGDWRNGAVAEGERFNQPLRAFQTTRHTGVAGRRFCLLSADSGVSVKAVKKSEKGGDWIVRVFETTGTTIAGARIKFGTRVVSVREANGYETPLPSPTLPVQARGNELAFDMMPYRPRTFAVRLAGGSTLAPKLVAWEPPLPFDCDVVGRQGEPGPVPAELWPRSLLAEGIEYRLGPADGNNAMACRGQTITLPREAKGRVSLLAACSESDVLARFGLGGKKMCVLVPAVGGFVGQWDSRVIDGKYDPDLTRMKPAFIKRTPVAWVGTHSHDSTGADVPYAFCYLFKVDLALPLGQRTLTLPNDPRIKVFAVTSVLNARPTVTPAEALYE